MSHIFDALQRSDADRAGKERDAESTATELLERAERQAASRWRSEAATESVIGLEGAEVELLSGGRTAVPDGLREDTEAGEAPQSAEREEVFRQFQVIAVSPPAQSRLVCLLDKESPAAEAFRLLKVRMRHLRKERPLKKVLITSTVPQEGKSFAAANLACALASGTQQRTLLIEGDVRRPSLTQLFGLEGTCGICEYAQGKRDLTSSIYRLEGPGIWFLPAGRASGDPLEAIQSARLPPLLQKVTGWFDWIIIDCPPVLPLADTSIWARLADGILLVARRDITRKKTLQRGLEALKSSKVIGALLNSSNGLNDNDYYYYRYASKPSKKTRETVD